MIFEIEDGILKDVESTDFETSMTIPDDVTSIESIGWGACRSVSSITIPDSVSTIEIGVFNSYPGLENFYVSEHNLAYAIVDGVLYNKELTELIRCPQKKASVNIPLSVTSIVDNAFMFCVNLTSIEIPDGVICICKNAFNSCTSLTSITIPSSVISIGDEAFTNCSKLRFINISNGVISIGDSAFNGCSELKSVTLPDSLTSIGELAFENCHNLVFVNIPSSVTHIGGGAFAGCEFSSIEISKANRAFTISDGVLYNSKKTQIISCSYTVSSFVIPNSVTSITNSAFSYCELTSITIPDGVTIIGNASFYFCRDLVSITVPDSVVIIGENAFSSCSNLTIINIPPCVKSINDFTFGDCTSLTSVDIPSGVTSIGLAAFKGCESLKTVTIPESVEIIGFAAFQDCPQLTIYAPANSYAESYARENEIAFVAKTENVSAGASHRYETKTTKGRTNIIRSKLDLVTNSEDQLYNDFYDSFDDSDEPFGGCIFLISIMSEDIVSIIVERYADQCGESGLSKYDVVTSDDGIPVHLFRESGICMFEISNEGEYGGPLPQSQETLTDIVKYWVKNFFRNDESRNFEGYELDQYIESAEYLEMMNNLKCKGTYYQGRFKYSEDIADCVDPSHMRGFGFAENYIDDYISDYI